MKKILMIIQIVIAVLLVALIMLQGAPDTGATRLSLVKPKFNRRGIEKFTFVLTLITLFIFLTLSFTQLLI